MWIIIGILASAYVIYKAFEGAVWAWIVLIAGVAYLCVQIWEYMSFVLVVLGIGVVLTLIASSILRGIGEAKMSETNALVEKQERTMLQVGSSTTNDSVSKRGTFSLLSSSNNADSVQEKDIYADCLSEIQMIERELLPMINQMADQIDKSYSKIAQTVSDLAEIAIDYSDGVLSKKGQRTAMIVSSLVSAGIEWYGKWKSEQERKRQLAKLLVKKQAFANTHLTQVQKLSPIVKRQRARLKMLVDKKVTSASYKISQLRDFKMLTQLKNNAGKSLALYRQVVYYDMLVDYLNDEYQAWLGGFDDSSSALVTMYDVNLVLSKEVVGSNDKLKTEFRRLVDLDNNSTESLSGGDILLLSDMQLTAVALLNTGAKYLQKEMDYSNDVVGHLLNDNPVYMDYEKRYQDYKKVTNGFKRKWGWLGSLPIVMFLIYKFFGSEMPEV